MVYEIPHGLSTISEETNISREMYHPGSEDNLNIYSELSIEVSQHFDKRLLYLVK